VKMACFGALWGTVFEVKMPAKKASELFLCIYRDNLLQSEDSRHIKDLPIYHCK